MSTIFQTEPQSRFPEGGADLIGRLRDPSSPDLPLISQYYQLFNAGNLTAANALINSNPQLQNLIMNAFNFNALRDAIVTTQRYFLACGFTQVRGLWNSNINYVLGDMVSFNNALWQAQANNANSQPSDTNVNWLKIVWIDQVNLIINWNQIINRPTTLSGYGITDAEPLRTIATQTEAGTGTSTTVRSWTPQRVKQTVYSAWGTTAGTAPAYTLAFTGFALADGQAVLIKMHSAITAASTLNINGTGAKQIRNLSNIAVTTANVNSWLYLIYSSALDCWITQSSEDWKSSNLTVTADTAVNGDVDTAAWTGTLISLFNRIRQKVNWLLTGSNTANLIAINPRTFKVTIPATGWTVVNNKYQQTITVSGITNAMVPIYDLDTSGWVQSENFEIYRNLQKEATKIAQIVTNNGSITVRTWDAVSTTSYPSVAINLILKA